MTVFRAPVQTWLNYAIEFAFPPLCSGCGKYCENDAAVCDRCRATFDRYTRPLCLTCEQPIPQGVACPICRDDCRPLFAFAHYIDPLQEIIKELKFKGVSRPASLLARELAGQFAELILQLRAEYLVPIPLHPSREYQRGYNQAELIGRELSDCLNLPVRTDWLLRTGKRQPQSKLRTPEERRRNIRGVFAAVNPPEQPCRVLLVDDVVTSGMTVREAARVLAEINVNVVGVLSLAHGA